MQRTIQKVITVTSLLILFCPAYAHACGDGMDAETRPKARNASQSAATPAGPAATVHFADAMPGDQGHRLRDISFHRVSSGEGRIQVAMEGATGGIDIKQQGGTVIVEFQKTGMPQGLKHKLDLADFATPVDSVDASIQDGNARLVIESHGSVEWAAYQLGDKFTVEIMQIGERSNYAGKRLTVRGGEIKLRDALALIADSAGLNIVISDAIGGSLVMRLQNMPWDRALDAILESKGLEMRRNGNVILVAPLDERPTSVGAIDEDWPAPLHTEVFDLKYQKGENLVAMLANGEHPILSKRGSTVVDKRTNRLFVRDTPERMEEVRKLVKQLDVAGSQAPPK